MNNIISDKRLKEIINYLDNELIFREQREKQVFLDVICVLENLQGHRDALKANKAPAPPQPEVYGLRELTAKVKELEMKLIDPMYLFNKFATNEALEVLGNRIKDLEGEIRRIHYAISFKDDEGAVY